MTEQVAENAQVSESPAESPDREQVGPNIEKNLFWDDLRIGLGTVRVGVLVLLLGLLANVSDVKGFFSLSIIVVGAIVTVIGLHVCTSMPRETGAQQLSLGATGCAALCLLLTIINNGAEGYRLITGAPFKEASSLCLLLGVSAHLLLAMSLVRAATYLRAKSLTKKTELYFQTTLAFSLLFLLFSLSCLYSSSFDELIAFKAVFGILIVASAVALWALLGKARRTIAVLYQGGALTEAEAAPETVEEEPVTAEGEVVPDRPMQPVSQPYFPDEQWNVLHADDRGAGGVIVKLMTGIFCVGVGIYVIVLLLVSTD